MDSQGAGASTASPRCSPVYPDAGVVLTHRDPLEVARRWPACAPCCATCSATPPTRTRSATRSAGAGRRASTAPCACDSGSVPADRFVDVMYRDLLQDPIGVVRRVYAHFGRSLSPAAEERMRRFLAAHPKDRFGRRYSLEQFGRRPRPGARRDYRDYRERFGL
ncbi:MAG: sulfotransferase [Candidatus Binatia bacterium]